MPLPILGALGAFLGGTGSAILGGSILGGIAQHSANQSAVEQANANRAFSANAHQIEVADLYKAGLNPLLSGKYQGASLGGGVMPDIKPLVDKDIGSRVVEGSLQGTQKQLLQAGLIKTNAESALLAAQAKNVETDERLKRVQMLKEISSAGDLRASEDQRRQGIEESKQKILNMRAEIPEIASRIRLQGAERALADARETGAKIDNQVKDATFNSLVAMAKSDALIRDYQATEQKLGATAAQAAWRIAMAEAGITERQLELIAKMVPNLAFLITR